MGKLTKQQQAMIAVAAVFVVGLWVYFTYLLKPTMADIATKQARLTELTGQIENAERQARRLPALMAEKEQLEKELTTLEKQLPRDQDKPNIIRVLTREALQENMDFERLTPKPIETRDFFQVIPFDISFSGNLQSLARFLASLGQQDRIFQAQNIRLTPTKSSTSDTLGNIQLAISMAIQTYAYVGN
jgi:type IV pilus assembly protein PilO